MDVARKSNWFEVMQFWNDLFHDIEISDVVSSELTLMAFTAKFAKLMEAAFIKVRVNLTVDGQVLEYDWTHLHPAFVGSASIFDGQITRDPLGLIHLSGILHIRIFVRIFYQIILAVGWTISAILFVVSGRRFLVALISDHSVDVTSLEVCSAGALLFGGLLAVVWLISYINYLSTRGQRSLILTAFSAAADR